MFETTYKTARQNLQHSQASSTRNYMSPPLPAYMTKVYDWAYVDPVWVRWLDHNLIVKTLLFFNDRRLMRRYLDRVQPGMRVWQVAHVYGNLVQHVAERTGSLGCFHLTDVTPIQVVHGRKKLDGIPWAKVIHQDAALYTADPGQPYDLICNFMLLHEVPDNWKRSIVDNMLAHMPTHGEVLFVEYHRPSIWQPIRWVLKVVNYLLEPFAQAVWDHDISHFASHPERYEWEKETLFGGVYQVVSVKNKASA